MDRLKFREDTDLMPEVQAASIRGTNPMATAALVIFICIIVGFLTWAWGTELDEVTRGEGQVVASTQNKIVQHLDGGIVEQIAVKEGDIVKKGQLLLRVVNTGGEAKLAEKKTEIWALRIRAARLLAEADGKEKLTIPKGLQKLAPGIVRREIDLFNSRLRNNRATLAALKQQALQRIQQLKEQKSLVKTMEKKLKLLADETSRSLKLVKRGLMGRLEYDRVERERQDTIGRVRTEKLGITRVEASIKEARQNVTEAKKKIVSEARLELNEIRKKESIGSEELKALGFRIGQTAVRSPVQGTIKQLRVATVGGVVKAGEPLVEIVPGGDSLLIEAQVRPSDRAFIRTGQTALVKITAYNYSKYGGLEGKVMWISESTLPDKAKKGEEFYKIRVKTTRNHLPDAKKLRIIPGMSAAVNIKTGRKSVLAFIFKPITKSTQGGSQPGVSK